MLGVDPVADVSTDDKDRQGEDGDSKRQGAALSPSGATQRRGADDAPASDGCCPPQWWESAPVHLALRWDCIVPFTEQSGPRDRVYAVGSVWPEQHTALLRPEFVATYETNAVGIGRWVVNGPDETCIIQVHGGPVSCVPRGTFVRKGVSLGVVILGPPPAREARGFVVAGIVPNWIGVVDLRVGDKSKSVVVKSNSYSFRAAVPILVKRFERY